jgi:hypothetical protein
MKKIISQILGISQTSFYRWKGERPIIDLLEKYFTESELEQFLRERRIDRFENENSESTLKNEFYTNNALHKIIVKSTLPLDENDSHLLTYFKAIMNKNKRYSVLPLKSFLNLLNNPKVINAQTFMIAINESDLQENWKSIIVKFIQYELSTLEVNALIQNRIRIKKFFDNEKIDKNCMLNFS